LHSKEEEEDSTGHYVTHTKTLDYNERMEVIRRNDNFIGSRRSEVKTFLAL
jgi:hypothetical protein